MYYYYYESPLISDPHIKLRVIFFIISDLFQTRSKDQMYENISDETRIWQDIKVSRTKQGSS